MNNINYPEIVEAHNKAIEELVVSAKEILNSSLPEGAVDTGNGFIIRDKQVSTITAITRRLNWKRKAVFNFILRYFPDHRERLKAAELKSCKLSALYSLMNKAEKSNIISRLDSIQNRNKAKHGVKKCQTLYQKKF